MARTVRRLRIEQKAAQLGLDVRDEIPDDVLLTAIRKTNKDFLVAEDKRTPEQIRNTLVRVSLVCHNRERRERGREQIFLTINGQQMGQAMFYDEMEDAWHFSEAFLDALLGMTHPDIRVKKVRIGNGVTSADTNGQWSVTGMKYDFSARLLPPLTQKQLDRIKTRQLARDGVQDDEPMEI